MAQAVRQEVLPQLLAVRPARVGEPVRLRVRLSVTEPFCGGRWSFGDGHTAVAAVRSGPRGSWSHVVHTYRRAGVHVITLVLEDDSTPVVEGLIAVVRADRSGYAASGVATAAGGYGDLAFAFVLSEAVHPQGATGALRLRSKDSEYRSTRIGWWIATSDGWLHMGAPARSRSSAADAWGRPRDLRISLRLAATPSARPRLSIHIYPPGSQAGRSTPELSLERPVRRSDVTRFGAGWRD